MPTESKIFGLHGKNLDDRGEFHPSWTKETLDSAWGEFVGMASAAVDGFEVFASLKGTDKSPTVLYRSDYRPLIPFFNRSGDVLEMRLDYFGDDGSVCSFSASKAGTGGAVRAVSAGRVSFPEREGKRLEVTAPDGSVYVNGVQSGRTEPPPPGRKGKCRMAAA